MRHINTIVIHCSATPPNMDIGAKEIREWHLQRGWSDIGYHYVIRRNGNIELGRPVERIGAHVRGFNRYSIGICLVGGLEKSREDDRRTFAAENYTEAQWFNLQFLVKSLLAEHSSIASVCGHNDMPGTSKSCPNFNVAQWVHKTL